MTNEDDSTRFNHLIIESNLESSSTTTSHVSWLIKKTDDSSNNIDPRDSSKYILSCFIIET